MKIRNGFVSNSSSSSFIVAFTHEPTSVDDVKKMMFGEQQHFSGYYSTDVYSTETIAETIFADIQQQRANDMKKMVESVANGWNDFSRNNINRTKYIDKNNNFNYKTYDEHNIKFSKKFVEKFVKQNKNCVLYVFHYSDNDGSYFSTLEHGGIFNKLKHIQTSYH